MDEVKVSGAPFEMNFEMIEMPGEGAICFECKEQIFGKMFQYFLFSGNTDPMPTKFRFCETCFNEPEK